MGLEKGHLTPKYKGSSEDIKIAKELCYPKVVISLLANEPDRSKRTRILHDARMGKYGAR